MYRRVIEKINQDFECLGVFLNNHSSTLVGRNLLATDAMELHFVNKKVLVGQARQEAAQPDNLPNAPFRLSIWPELIV